MAKVDDLLDEMFEAEERKDRGTVLEKADLILELDPNHTDALWASAMHILPPVDRRGMHRSEPDLVTCSKAVGRLKRLVAADPTHRAGWARGALLISQHLGMTEAAIQWYEDMRVPFPTDPTPCIEQAELLIRMGRYADAAGRLAACFARDMEEIPGHQRFRVERMNQTIERYLDDPEMVAFRPQDPKHRSWKDIETMRHAKPASEMFLFFMLAGPLVFWEGMLLREFVTPSWWKMAVAFVLVYISVMLVKRFSIKLTAKRNRPVRDLWRAIEVESTSGMVCVPELIRGSKLYRTVLQRDYPLAFVERHDKILAKAVLLPKRWELTLPDWTEEE